MNKKNIIVCAVIGILLLVIGVLVGIIYCNKEEIFKHEKTEQQSEKINVDNNSDEKNIVEEKKDNDKNYDKPLEKEEVKNMNENKSENNVKNDNNTVKYSNNDNLVINELNSTLESINEAKSDKDFSEKAKATFISIVDFLFYDGTINGVTFNELTTSGKEKVLELANKIDTKLEEKSPGYKDKISSGTSKAFNKASEVIKKGAKNINDFAKEALGNDNYNSIIDAKDELVKYSKNAFSFVRGVGSKLYSNTKDKLNEWYQNFKNN